MLPLFLAASAVLLVTAQNATNSSSSACITASKGVHVPGTIPCNPYEPLQQRLSFAGPNGMMVSWSTHAKLDTPEVWYGGSPYSLSKVAKGSSVTHPTSWVYENHVKITGLKPQTKYWYRTSNQLSFFFASNPATIRSSQPLHSETAPGVLTGPQTHSRRHVQLAKRTGSPSPLLWISV
jgi:hypothetical protein